MADIQSISSQIDALVEQNTLSGLGVKALEALRVRVAAQEVAMAAQNERVSALTANLAKTTSELSAATGSLARWNEREAALVKREASITALEKSAAVAEGQTTVFRECFSLVFRNLETRENLRVHSPLVVPGANGSCGYVQVGETRTEAQRSQA